LGTLLIRNIGEFFTGDIERPVESALTRDDDTALSAQFLKVPHHGSKTSSTQAFIDAVHPQFAAISVGDGNAFGQPSPEVVERIEAEGARLYRTDRDGAITTLADGHDLRVTTFFDPR
jgi:competence protein ComEC